MDLFPSLGDPVILGFLYFILLLIDIVGPEKVLEINKRF